ncbi:hypothetical protein [Chryseolinea sp. H1M3-3]|uniref:hypothetical protein n=1 Tax=Chryseolinea sp. H1M3-3 TaxID=3034144 RepID=UPI0023EBC446|nr:hypothetical protein [Chryseolinea sp. H1M3-3]
MIKNKQTLISILIVGMALGTAWAIRGKFGHEQGAAWAGAIGAISVVLVAKRRDWYNNVFKIALAAAVGWGLSGMISYGQIVGYGRSVDFGNAYYGLLMLFVIGVLYGFLGGGLFGLALADSKDFKVTWTSLIAEMLAFALLTYGLLINQLEWFMTPPRSELWAACLGASIALGWYVLRNRQQGVLKVAIWSALGAGVGFAFGNFLQVLGAGSSLSINFWNVMEYSIGFFGGLGMAYGTLTSSWAVSNDHVNKHANLFPILFLMVFIPFVLWDQSFVTEKLKFIVELGGNGETIFWFQSLALISIVVCIVIIIAKYYRSQFNFNDVRTIFLLYLGVYTFLSFLLTGIYTHPIEQYLYLVNIVVIVLVLPGIRNNFEVKQESSGPWVTATLVSVLLIAMFAVIAIQTHGELGGSQTRFK